jgi:hypothetical protein
LIAFIDESGFPHPNDNTQNPVLAAVCIPREELRNVINKMYKIKTSVYDKPEMEIKASKLIRYKSIETHTLNKQFVEEIMKNLLVPSQNIKVFAIVMDKPKRMPWDLLDENILPNYYRLLLQRIGQYSSLQKKNCILAFDSRDEGNDILIANKIKNYLYKSNEGKRCTSIIESSFFVNSKIEEGLQLADLCAGIIRKYYELCYHKDFKGNKYSEWINELYVNYIENITMNIPNIGLSARPEHLFGIYKVNLEGSELHN